MLNLDELRHEYMRAGLDEKDVLPDPLEQFALWFAEAMKAGLPLPNAMSLASVTRAGRPSQRMVLLKGMDHGGFAFYTHYDSRKARELAVNAQASLLFHWPQLERQVRIEGMVTRISDRRARCLS